MILIQIFRENNKQIMSPIDKCVTADTGQINDWIHKISEYTATIRYKGLKIILAAKLSQPERLCYLII